MEDAYRLASNGLLSLLSYSIQVHLSGDGTAHFGLDPHVSVISQENAPMDMSSVMEVVLQFRFPLPRWPQFVSS